MQSIQNMPNSVVKNICCVMTDIDDTLTTDGLLPAEAYQGLEDLHQAGFWVVPITGRPAGWCDMVARFWPVCGVVGENGAFYFAYDHHQRKMLRRYHHSDKERQANAQKLKEIENQILAQVKGCAVSADQAYRESDLAIDFCEDVPPLNKQDVQRIKQIFEENGAVAKVSSIHVNGWFGDYDKLTMSHQFAKERLNLDLHQFKEKIVFCGDSPNDAPMFEFFPNSCGVANVLDFQDQIQTMPTWVTKQKGGQGFFEMTRVLIGRK